MNFFHRSRSSLLVLSALVVLSCAKDKPVPRAGKSEHAATGNRLIHEKSPYLLQHAHNPVDWYPWGPEAFEKAKSQDKPIFLSIGYSTCHWCHVMERESFEDPEVAELLNRYFIAIKVDREERPDIDNIYMTVAQMMTGSGGWPLTIMMTPDQKPFFAATYIPKAARFGRPGMMALLPGIHEAWISRRGEILATAGQAVDALHKNAGAAVSKELGIAALKTAYNQLAGQFDEERGGFGSAPKFPTPHNLVFLMRYWNRTGDKKALRMAEKTLTAMRLGGIYDHVGFGFHRYSTDQTWFAPHFEKMLYDQALLMMAYTEAFEATGKALYAQTVREIAVYVGRDMTDSRGGFYSAEDADSEGREGKFYLWTQDEIRQLLAPGDAAWVCKIFHASPHGNFNGEASGENTGSNIFHLSKNGELPLAGGFPAFLKQWTPIREKLFTLREKRINPHKDDKILTDWNGLMITAFAKAGRALGEPALISKAEKAADFVLARLRQSDGRLLHRYRDGAFGLPAHVEDYAFMVWGLLELYESTFDTRHLEAADELTETQIKLFWDKKYGGFFFTAEGGEPLLTRPKEIYDGAIPSGNSVSMLNLLRLAKLTGRAEFEKMASELAGAFGATVERSPSAHTLLMTGLDYALGPGHEVVIAGNPSASDTRAMIDTLRGRYLPRMAVLLKPGGTGDDAVVRLAPFTKSHASLDGKATAYVCRDFICHFPTTDPSKMLELLTTWGN